jgi:hypothetical protein
MIIFVLYLLKFCIFLYFSAPQHHIPPLVPVTHDARELWEDVDIYIYRTIKFPVNLILFILV